MRGGLGCALLVVIAGCAKPSIESSAVQPTSREAQPTAPSEKPSRAGQFKEIQSEYDKAHAEIIKTIREGKAKPNPDGGYRELIDLQARFAKPARALIDADSSDEVGLDTILFSLGTLGVGENDPSLYQLLLKHHLASSKIDPIVKRPDAPVEFLQAVVTGTPHDAIRAFATYHLAENLYYSGKPTEAVPLLEKIRQTPDWAKLGGYQSGTLSDTAGRLLFEIRNLNVGNQVPELTGTDLDNKPLKLSEYRGKVVLLVFWATWCRPCMAMIPHERQLAESYAKRPFAVVGVNGDILEGLTLGGGKKIDGAARVKAAVEKEKITWRSFRNGQFDIGEKWNVRSWPTVYLIDHNGVIRGKWRGGPEEKELDSLIEKLVISAETEGRKLEK